MLPHRSQMRLGNDWLGEHSTWLRGDQKLLGEGHSHQGPRVIWVVQDEGHSSRKTGYCRVRSIPKYYSWKTELLCVRCAHHRTQMTLSFGVWREIRDRAQRTLSTMRWGALPHRTQRHLIKNCLGENRERHREAWILLGDGCSLKGW